MYVYSKRNINLYNPKREIIIKMLTEYLELHCLFRTLLIMDGPHKQL